MSQNDFTIANQGFPAFRSDLNSALQALASNNSGTSAPSTTFANMWWYDSSNNIMYIRNEDNDAWIKFAELDQTNDKFILSGTLQLDDGSASAPALTFNSDTNMGIYRGGTDILKLVTAGTDAITIDASQNVGIGISSPSLPLEVSGSSFPQVRIHRDFAATSASSATIRFAGDDSAGNVTDYAEIRSLTEVVTNGSEAGALLFGTLSSGSVTERMRIESNGNVIVGSSTFGADDSIGLAGGGTITSAKASSGGTTHLIFKNGGSQVGGITSNTGATFFNTSSDYRLKENVTYNFDATTRLKQLKPSRFNFIADKDTTVDGFLAHEVASIVPEAISGEKDAVDSDGNIISQAIDQSKIVPLLVKTIQELEARITTLEGA